jgi:hypothetical protein
MYPRINRVDVVVQVVVAQVVRVVDVVVQVVDVVVQVVVAQVVRVVDVVGYLHQLVQNKMDHLRYEQYNLDFLEIRFH